MLRSSKAKSLRSRARDRVKFLLFIIFVPAPISLPFNSFIRLTVRRAHPMTSSPPQLQCFRKRKSKGTLISLHSPPRAAQSTLNFKACHSLLHGIRHSGPLPEDRSHHRSPRSSPRARRHTSSGCAIILFCFRTKLAKGSAPIVPM